MASFTNVATLSYGGNQVSSNVVTGEIREVLTVSKTAVPAAYAVGDTITYVIYLINSGTAALTGLTVTDDLGGYAFGAGTVYPLRYTDGTVRYFANGALQAAPDVTAGPPLRFKPDLLWNPVRYACVLEQLRRQFKKFKKYYPVQK